MTKLAFQILGCLGMHPGNINAVSGKLKVSALSVLIGVLNFF